MALEGVREVFEEDDFFRAANELHDTGKINSPNNIAQDLPRGVTFITTTGLADLENMQQNKHLQSIGKRRDFNRRLLNEDSTVPQVNLLFESTAATIKELDDIELASRLTKIKIKDAYGQEVRTYLEENLSILNEAEELCLSVMQPDSESPATESESPSWERLTDGSLTVFTFLKIDIVSSSQISRTNSYQTVEVIFEAFYELVKDAVEALEGRIWKWDGDGGLCAFLSNNTTEMAENGVQCASTILKQFVEFNRTDRTVTQVMQVRIAVHIGHANYKSNTGLIHSDAINFVAHLEGEKKKTGPNCISISEDVYKELSGDLRDIFSRNGVFEDLTVFSTN